MSFSPSALSMIWLWSDILSGLHRSLRSRPLARRWDTVLITGVLGRAFAPCPRLGSPHQLLAETRTTPAQASTRRWIAARMTGVLGCEFMPAPPVVSRRDLPGEGWTTLAQG